MVRVAVWSCIVAVWLAVAPCWSHAATVQGMRLWRAPDNTRVVLDLSGPAEHKLLTLPGEGDQVQQLIVLVKEAEIKANPDKVDLAHSPIERMQWGTHDGQPALVIGLSAKVVPKSFLLPANEQYGHRLVLDLFDEDKLQVEPKVSRPAANGLRDVIIAVDAGHGGEDPGAKGPGGLLEKTVTLAIARELARKINDTPGYSAFLTRSGDYFVSLRGRTAIARRKGADLFVSIHADAFKDSSAQGAGVFALSERGATSEAARWLAQSENASDLVGGVNLGDKDPLLQEVLLDLSMTATVATSLDMGDKVLREMKHIARLHRGHVEQAGFVVLKNPDIPSLLVETGFITNSEEARKLAKPEYRSKMAQAIFAGIDKHFRARPPMDTALAAARGGTVQRTVDKVPSIGEAELDLALAEEDRAQDAGIVVRRDDGAARKAAEEEDELARLVSARAKAGSGKPGVQAKTSPSGSANKKDRKGKTSKTGKEHVVVRGETLSGIASRYKVSMVALKDHNKLTDDTVRIGQKLRIPTTR